MAAPSRRPLRIGIQLPEVERQVRWPEVMAMARAAEECGFDSVWLGDHLLYRGDGRPERGPWEAWTTLSALAASTERLVLGPLVACAAFHPPGVIAKMAATIGDISGGRFVLGLGAGWNAPEFSAFGLPQDHRVSRFEDSFAIVRGLLRGERVTLDGTYWQADDAVLVPAPAAPVPLMIGSNGPRMLSIALPHADAWNTWYDGYGNTAEGFASLNTRISEAAVAAGRVPAEITRSACAFVLVDPSSDEREIKPEAPPITGTPAQIAARLRELHDAGADEVVLVVSPITEASIRALGEAVAAV
ncbi:F420-dependent glucose-6-phosphate dehydrogenase [Baekduia alba]|uniref:LLM class flavin-dependent oxidoreductase n=1 Tax=Baekduia alba TaxID=2997333 RepID=UPI00234284D1|nr:LLM class flavin-dependent oxidoreductase [Baekduia alba]WCB94321.1 F420-dependent glucose-6-phosphate dehydrogenase [Baekduia alba]